MPDQTDEGVFLSTNTLLDPSQITDMDVNSNNFKDFLINLVKTINEISSVVNIKDSGKYELSEFITGQILYPDPATDSTTTTPPTYRPIYRKVFFFDALANNGTVEQLHNITIDNNVNFLMIRGAANDPGTSFIPLPYASKTDSENIAVYLDSTKIYITTGDDRTGYTDVKVVVLYTKE